MSNVLELADVSVRRGQATLLDSVSWTVREDERWVVLGANGAGKTTLVQLCSAQIHPTAGVAGILGEVLGTVDVFELRPRIGYTSAASIQLSIPTEGFSLELCSGKDCTPGPVEGAVEVGSTATPVATGIFGLAGDGVTGWTATLLDSPPVMGYRVSDASGVIVQEGFVEVDWVRVWR